MSKKKIISIITIENTKDLHLITYSIYFKTALIDCLHTFLPNIRSMGCYYHHCKNIYDNAKKLGLLKKELKATTELILNTLYQIPYNIMK